MPVFFCCHIPEQAIIQWSIKQWGSDRMDERYAISRYEQAVLLLPPKWQRLARQLPDHQKVLA